MKIDYIVELSGYQTDCKELSDVVKEIWKSEGNLMKDLDHIKIYFKPDEKRCYYVINSTNEGSFEI